MVEMQMSAVLSSSSRGTTTSKKTAVSIAAASSQIIRSPPTPLRVDTLDGYELTLRVSSAPSSPFNHRRSELLLVMRLAAPGSLVRKVLTSSSIFSDCRRLGLKMQISARGTAYRYAATYWPTAHVFPKRRGQQIMTSWRASFHPFFSRIFRYCPAKSSPSYKCRTHADSMDSWKRRWCLERAKPIESNHASADRSVRSLTSPRLGCRWR